MELLKKRGRPPKAQSLNDVKNLNNTPLSKTKESSLSKQLMKDVLKEIEEDKQSKVLENESITEANNPNSNKNLLNLLNDILKLFDLLVDSNLYEEVPEEVIELEDPTELLYKSLLNALFKNLPLDLDYNIYDSVNNRLYQNLILYIELTMRNRTPITYTLYPVYYTDYTINFLKLMKYLFGHLTDDVKSINGYLMLLSAVTRYNLSHNNKQRTIMYLKPITLVLKTENK